MSSKSHANGIRAARDPWIARLSPPKVWLTRKGEHHRTRGIGPTTAVLPRSLLIYRCFDLGDIPANERDAALAQRLEQATPFERYGAWLVRRGRYTMAWLWDRDEVPSGVAGRAVPESLLQRPPSGAGLRLVAQGEGYEGQYWASDGVLRASRWWGEPPALLDWQRFERAAGLQASDTVPSAEAPEWLPRPWASNHRLSRGMPSQGLRWAALLLVMGLTVEVTAGAVEAWRWSQRQAQLVGQIDRLETQAETVLAARQRARDARAKAETLYDALRAVRQLPLMADVISVVEARASRSVAAWNYNQRRLKLHITGVGDTSNVVSGLEDLPGVESVGIDSTREDQLRLRMEVVPRGR